MEFSATASRGSATPEARSSRQAITSTSPRVTRELARAERLYAQGSYEEARAAFHKIGASVPAPDRDLVRLRLAEIDYHTGLLDSGFRFVNPNVTDTCGCGESIRFEPLEGSAARRES